MTTLEAAAQVAAELHRADAVRRVLVSRADGLAFYDDEHLELREAGAAVLAGLGGAAQMVADALRLGAAEGVVVMGADAATVVRRVSDELVVAVVVDASADLSDVYRRVRSAARSLGRDAL